MPFFSSNRWPNLHWGWAKVLSQSSNFDRASHSVYSLSYQGRMGPDGDGGPHFSGVWQIKLKARIKDLINTYFAYNYKFSAGWERCKVVGIEKNKKSPNYGMFIVKFMSESNKRCLMLAQEDYDVDGIWLQIKRL